MRNTDWNERFSELLEFKQKWGHCDVPQKYAKNRNLRKWVRKHRWKYILLNIGMKSFISDERMLKLENVGFKWETKSSTQETMCDKNITGIQEFKQQCGHIEGPK